MWGILKYKLIKLLKSTHIKIIRVIIIKYEDGHIMCKKAKSDLNEAMSNFDISIFTDDIKKNLNDIALRISKVKCSNTNAKITIGDLVTEYIWCLIKLCHILKK